MGVKEYLPQKNRKKWLAFAALVMLILPGFLIFSGNAWEGRKMRSSRDGAGPVIQLPKPQLRGKVSVEEALVRRESVRSFSSKPLTESELSQILWSAQGITRPWGGRTAPSAGALYPLELYVVLRDGLFHYVPQSHQLIRVSDKNLSGDLTSAALGQDCLRKAPAVVVIAAVYERIERKYGRRGERYVKIEVGHAAQNILLQAVALGLGAVPIGAYYDDRVQKVLNLPVNHEPLYLIPVGHREK
jgi:SagB-type dehydrogenase family enzyme